MTEPISCSFCGTGRTDVRFMMEGPTVAICGDCVCHAVRLMAHGDTALVVTLDTGEVFEGHMGGGSPAYLPRGEVLIPKGGGGGAPGMKPAAAKGGPT